MIVTLLAEDDGVEGGYVAGIDVPVAVKVVIGVIIATQYGGIEFGDVAGVNVSVAVEVAVAFCAAARFRYYVGIVTIVRVNIYIRCPSFVVSGNDVLVGNGVLFGI